MVWNTLLCFARLGQPAWLCPFLDSGPGQTQDTQTKTQASQCKETGTARGYIQNRKNGEFQNGGGKKPVTSSNGMKTAPLRANLQLLNRHSTHVTH